MFVNYLKIAWRNILRDKGYSLINIFGLAIGITCFVLIMLFVADEMSYDRYHAKADRIYRLEREGVFNGLEFRTHYTAHPMGPALESDYPEIIASTRINKQAMLLKSQNNSFVEEYLYITDQNLFDVFDFHLEDGDPITALKEPNTVVISEEKAIKFFGHREVIGKTLTAQWGDTEIIFEITGVMEKMPANSHFHADFFVSYSTLNSILGQSLEIWLNNNISTYALLADGSLPEDLYSKFPAFIEKYMGAQIRQFIGPEIDVNQIFHFILRPMTEIHLYSDLQGEMEPPGSIATVYTFLAIAVFMLLIACINFMNLATARSARRAREVGIRKMVGANRKRLVVQFLGESLLLAYLATAISLAIIILVLPSYNAFTLKELSIHPVDNPLVLPTLLLVATVVGLLAGIYPAFFLSAYRPVEVLKGTSATAHGSRSALLRRILVTLQFAISIVLIISTLVVTKQMRYLENKKLGFTTKQMLVIEVQDDNSPETVQKMKNQFALVPGIESIGASNRVPGGGMFGDTMFRGEDSPEGDMKDITVLMIDEDFIPTLDIQLLAGRNFSREFSSDWETGIILNELAAKEFGWNTPEEAVGKTVYSILEVDPPTYLPNKVVGIVDNFHFKSLHQKLEPLLIHTGQIWGGLNYLTLQIPTSDIASTLKELRTTWQKLSPDYPFEYFFLDDNFNQLYQVEQRMQTIFRYFTLLTIFIACLGLLGLASYAAEQRTKEIGIRKTLGASVISLTVLMSREFITLVGLSALAALPAGWYLMNKWLENFAYRTEIGPVVLIAAAILAVVIAIFTVSFQAIKAALANPVKALKYE